MEHSYCCLLKSTASKFPTMPTLGNRKMAKISIGKNNYSATAKTKSIISKSLVYSETKLPMSSIPAANSSSRYYFKGKNRKKTFSHR